MSEVPNILITVQPEGLKESPASVTVSNDTSKLNDYS
jgi:hypothetical protein